MKALWGIKTLEKHCINAPCKLTLATVPHIEPTGENVAGLVTELVCEPGVGTALIAVWRPPKTSETSCKLPHLSTSSTRPPTDPGRKPTAPCCTCQIKRHNILDMNKRGTLIKTVRVDVFTEAVSSIPVTGRVVAGFVAVAIFDPRSWAALSTVGDRPSEIHLQGGEERND